MALATYADLQVAVARWVGGSDASTTTSLGFSSTIADVITIAESRIFREAKTKDTEASLSTAIAAGTIAVPSDYIAWKFGYVNSTPVTRLEPRSADWIYANYPTRSAGGIPKFFAREAGNFIFGPYPDSTYTVNAVYYKRLAALSTTNHALFTNNPDLYLFACLAECEILVGQDKRIQMWEAKYQKILADVNGYSRISETANAGIQMRTG